VAATAATWSSSSSLGNIHGTPIDPGAATRIPVPELLADPHPVVGALRNQPARLPASAQNRSRTLMLLEALAREAERRGLAVRAGQDTALLQIVADEEPYGVRVHEQTGARWTLRLMVGLTGAGTGDRDRWADRAKQPVEEQLGDILDKIVRRVRAVSEERRRRQRREEQRQAAEQERLLTDYRAGILREQVQAWRLTEDIRSHCDQLVTAGMDPDDNWLRWARRYADEVDPVIDPPDLPAPPDPAELHRQRRPAPPVGFQIPVMGVRAGLLRGSFVLGDEPAEDGSAFDPLMGEVDDGAFGSWGPQLQGPVWPSPVVVTGIFAECSA
jgi:hypothetical protein